MVYDLTRFARNTGDSLVMLGDIQAKGADFCSIKQKIDTGTPQGRLIHHAVSVQHAGARADGGEGVGQHAAAVEGRAAGKKALFGWRWVKKGAPFDSHPEQQAVIARVRQMLLMDANSTCSA